MGKKKKLKQFAEVANFHHFFQPTYDELLQHGFKLKGAWHTFFDNHNPIVIELGCGKGDYTVALARRYPNKNFIGFDIKGNRMWRGARNALDESISNVAFVRTTIELLEYYFSYGEVSEIWITFPDPQLEKPRHRKRLTHELFLQRYRNILIPKNIIHLKTDSQPFFDFTLAKIEQYHFPLHYVNHNVYQLPIDPKMDREVIEIQTFYESIWLKEERTIQYLNFTLTDVSEEQRSFAEKVYAVVSKIPAGRVTTYGAIAEAIGARKSARMVGWAINKAHLATPPVPAHRVVNRVGLLTGKRHFGADNVMIELLESEGVKIENNTVMAFQQHFWHPIHHKERNTY